MDIPFSHVPPFMMTHIGEAPLLVYIERGSRTCLTSPVIRLSEPPLMMTTSLGVAIVTGGAQGIGRGIVTRLSEDGFDVVIFDLPQTRELVEELIREVELAGRKVIAIYGDVQVEEDVERLVKDTVAKLGSVDVLVANAGVGALGTIIETSIADWDRLFNVNVKGVFLCYKAAARQMIKQGRGGRLIAASSNLGKRGTARLAAYSATKFAVRGLMQAAAEDYAQHEITSNCYNPAFVITPGLRWFGKQVDIQSRAETQDEWINQVTAGNPIKRMSTVEDVASLVSFLASKSSSYITGQSLSCDGGATFS